MFEVRYKSIVPQLPLSNAVAIDVLERPGTKCFAEESIVDEREL